MIRRVLVSAAVVLTLVGTTAAPAFADTVRDAEWQLTDLDMAKAQQITRGAGITVALIDSGVDAKHQDLVGGVLSGHNLQAATNTFEDPTGRRDTNGHGTQMAGIIAGRGHGSGDGVLGIAPAAQILPITVSVIGLGSGPFLKDAVAFAISQHAGVINISLGTRDTVDMQEGIRAAQAADIVVVAAAGNRGHDEGGYPGRYPEVLTVGSYGRDHEVSSFSVRGPQLDIVAPGDKIPSPDFVSHTAYVLGNGTSEATAVVSGAAALLRAKFPELSAAEIVHRLTATADDAGPPGRDDDYGYGRLDIVKALTADVPPLPPTATPTAGTSSAAPAAAAGATSVAVDDSLPKPASPLLLAGLIAAAVLVLGGLAVAAMLWRRRRAT